MFQANVPAWTAASTCDVRCLQTSGTTGVAVHLQVRLSGGAQSCRPASHCRRCRLQRTSACWTFPALQHALWEPWACAPETWTQAFICPMPALCHLPCKPRALDSRALDALISTENSSGMDQIHQVSVTALNSMRIELVTCLDPEYPFMCCACRCDFSFLGIAHSAAQALMHKP